jgi:hypothetical protein
MDKSQQQFITDLAEVLNITEEADMKKALEDIGSENIKKLFQGYSKLSDESQRKAYLKKQLTPEPTFAKLGAKLDYINYLKGKCPEGYEIGKFSAGGCMRCVKKSTGGTVDTEKPSTTLPKRFDPAIVENLKKSKSGLSQIPESDEFFIKFKNTFGPSSGSIGKYLIKGGSTLVERINRLRGGK